MGNNGSPLLPLKVDLAGIEPCLCPRTLIKGGFLGIALKVYSKMYSSDA